MDCLDSFASCRLLVSRLLLVVLLGLVPVVSDAATRRVADHYWDWGVGLYYSGVQGRWTELDAARSDWLMLRFPDLASTKETVLQLNRLLEINPQLKLMIRVWPVHDFNPGKGLYSSNTPLGRGSRYMYDYFFALGVKEKALAEARRQVRVVYDNITKPENIVGMSLLEELPQHITDMGVFLKDGETNWAIDAYREEIATELGEGFVWNSDARRWWCKKYVEMFDDFHRVMREEAGKGPDIIYWQQVGYRNLDHLPPNPPKDPFGGEYSALIPIQLSEIVKPGRCEGVFGYPNTAANFEADALRFARERNWKFFSQLSHPCFMRAEGWETTVDRTKVRMPQNLGTIFFCMGCCGGLPGKPEPTHWDPAIPPAERTPYPPPADGFVGPFHIEHTRRVFAQLGVNMDVVERHLAPTLALDYQLDRTNVDESNTVCLQVHNPKDPSWFLDPAEANLRNVCVRLYTPEGVVLAPGKAKLMVKLGDIEANGRRLITWPLQVSAGTKISKDTPLRVVLTADDTQDVEVVGDSQNVEIASQDSQEVYMSGQSWVKPTYRLTQPITPTLRLRALQKTAVNPTLSIGSASVGYQGTLKAGQQLRFGPDGSARLMSSNLVVGDTSVLNDPADPDQAKGWDQGQELFAVRMMNPAKTGARVRVTISGKATGGAVSMIRLKGFVLPASYDPWISEPILVGRLNDTWQEAISQEIQLPPEADVRHVVGYRLEQKGTVWYRDISVIVADEPAEGTDVSGQLVGKLPQLPVLPAAGGSQVQRPLLVTYKDESMPETGLPRVEVALEGGSP